MKLSKLNVGPDNTLVLIEQAAITGLVAIATFVAQHQDLLPPTYGPLVVAIATVLVSYINKVRANQG